MRAEARDGAFLFAGQTAEPSLQFRQALVTGGEFRHERREFGYLRSQASGFGAALLGSVLTVGLETRKPGFQFIQFRLATGD